MESTQSTTCLQSRVAAGDFTMLASFPPELVMNIAKHIEDITVLNALARSSTWAYNLVDHVLYQKDAADNSSAIHWAAQHDLPNTMKRALEAGANVDTIRNDKTGLMIAAAKGNMENAQLLLAKHASTNITNASGRTALDFVGPRYLRNRQSSTKDSYRTNTARMGPKKLAMMELLLEHDASPDVRGTDGRTLLYGAVKNQDENLIELLLRYGADPTLLDDARWSPLCIAMNLNERDESFNLLPARMLLACGSPVAIEDEGFAPIHIAACVGNIGGLELLIEYGSDISAPNSKGDTPLQVSIMGRQKKFAHALLESGAITEIDLADYPNLPLSDNPTPLHLALERGSISLFRAILTHDPDNRVREVFAHLPFEYYDKEVPSLILALKGLDAKRVKNIMLAQVARRG